LLLAQQYHIKIPPCGAFLVDLFFNFLVDVAGTAPVTKLLELDFALNKLFVFGRPVVNALAFGTLEFYKSVLRHCPKTIT
jgi:hypothetical protein